MVSSALLERRPNFRGRSISVERKRKRLPRAVFLYNVSNEPVEKIVASDESTYTCDTDVDTASGLLDDAHAAIVGLYETWINAYQPFEQLGQGIAGVVHRARRKADGQDVAVKIMRMHDDDEDHVTASQKEFLILMSIQHPFIITALDFIEFNMGAALVMEYFPGFNLKSAVHSAPGERLKETAVQGIFSKLVQAIAYLHRNEIIHRDVQAQNVLVSPRLDDIRLKGFNGRSTTTDTMDYMPPEVLLGGPPTVAGDIWAAGMCFYFMLCGKMPRDAKNFRSPFEFGVALSAAQSFELPSPLADQVSSKCKAVLWSCLKPEPKERTSAIELLNQQWIH